MEVDAQHRQVVGAGRRRDRFRDANGRALVYLYSRDSEAEALVSAPAVTSHSRIVPLSSSQSRIVPSWEPEARRPSGSTHSAVEPFEAGVRRPAWCGSRRGSPWRPSHLSDERLPVCGDAGVSVDHHCSPLPM